jgi:hypothetical protein
MVWTQPFSASAMKSVPGGQSAGSRYSVATTSANTKAKASRGFSGVPRDDDDGIERMSSRKAPMSHCRLFHGTTGWSAENNCNWCSLRCSRFPRSG